MASTRVERVEPNGSLEVLVSGNGLIITNNGENDVMFSFSDDTAGHVLNAGDTLTGIADDVYITNISASTAFIAVTEL